MGVDTERDAAQAYTPGHRNELLTPSMMQGFLENPTNRRRAELAASSDVANLDSIQILSNQEWFAVTEKRREIVMIRGRDCATLGSGGGVPEVRCGKPPHLFPCSAAALARLSTCTGIGGIQQMSRSSASRRTTRPATAPFATAARNARGVVPGAARGARTCRWASRLLRRVRV